MAHNKTPAITHKSGSASNPGRNVLTWSAGRRTLTVLPLVVILWAGVGWALLEATPW